MSWFGNKVDKDSLERSINRDEELIRELKSGNAWWFNSDTDDYDKELRELEDDLSYLKDIYNNMK